MRNLIIAHLYRDYPKFLSEVIFKALVCAMEVLMLASRLI